MSGQFDHGICCQRRTLPINSRALHFRNISDWKSTFRPSAHLRRFVTERPRKASAFARSWSAKNSHLIKSGRRTLATRCQVVADCSPSISLRHAACTLQSPARAFCVSLFPSVESRTMDTTESFPDWQRAVEEYESDFHLIYRRLTRSSSVKLPAAHELIQQFYANKWNRLKKSYRPRSGPARKYICGAFRNLIREAIREAKRRTSRCSELGELADQVADQAAESSFDAFAHDEEMKLLDDALNEIPVERRTVVRAYFDLGRPSERKLSEEYGISRNKVQRLLINGFGQLVMRLRARDLFLGPDQDVAIALWCDGLEVKDVALRLGQPVEQIGESRKRLMKVMKNLLRGRRVMSASSIDASPCPKETANSIP